MSPRTGRPTQDKRDRRFEIRLSADTYEKLEECSERLEITKTAVIHKGIAMVKLKLIKRNNSTAVRGKISDTIIAPTKTVSVNIIALRSCFSQEFEKVLDMLRATIYNTIVSRNKGG